MAKILTMIISFVIIPYAIGLLLEKKRAHMQIYITGFIFMLAVFLPIALVAICFSMKLTTLTVIWSVVCIILAVLGVCFKRKTVCMNWKEYKNISVWGVFAFVIILGQAAIVLTGMHLDQDDAFYVATATTAVETNTVMEIDPYMGFAYEMLPARYVLSPFPVFLAVISKLWKIHPTIIAHTIFPVVFLLMSYAVYMLIGRELFKDRRKEQVFLLAIVVVQMFSFFSVYTSGTFLHLRLWQGKAFLANIIIPFIFLLFAEMIKEEERKLWGALFITITAAALVSSMGILLGPLTLGMLTLGHIVVKRTPNILLKSLLCCSTSVILGTVYLLIR